jgi:glyceraldehyde 3-phosphate dehydrogenase
MKVRVAINGFGRIGRLSTRALLRNDNAEVVAVNDLTDSNTLASLFRYDTAQGKFSGTVSSDENCIIINDQKIKLLREKDPAQLPWKDLGIDVVLESTGLFTRKEDAEKHIVAGAARVVISAPAKGDVKTVVIGVNENTLNSGDRIVSNASCTTNCLAPMVKILDESFGIESGQMVTVHAYTSDQRLHDAPHKDLRRSRAAAQNIIPTTTGAAKAVTTVLPHLAGRLHGYALRVPVISGSITDFSCVTRTPATVEEVNRVFRIACETNLRKVMQYSTDPLVSSDIIGNPFSCIFDSPLTIVNDRLVKVVGWYDNEAGYSQRIADLINIMAKLG